MLESFEHVFDAWSQPWISNKHVFHEIYQVNVVVDLIKLLWGKEGFTRTSNPKMELKIVWSVKQELSSEQFIEKAASTPHIRETIGSDLLPSIILISVFSCVDRELQHFWRLAKVSSSIPLAKLILIIREDFAFTKVTNS